MQAKYDWINISHSTGSWHDFCQFTMAPFDRDLDEDNGEMVNLLTNMLFNEMANLQFTGKAPDGDGRRSARA
jgi:hypothetical protein